MFEEEAEVGDLEVSGLAAEVAEGGDDVERAVAMAANERAIERPQVKVMPVGPIDGDVGDVLSEEESSPEVMADEPAIHIPEEDGLARDWALYQQQASQKSWAYWLGGFGGRALLFLSLLAFSLWMATSAGWGLRVVLFGVIALVIHEVGPCGGHAGKAFLGLVAIFGFRCLTR